MSALTSRWLARAGESRVAVLDGRGRHSHGDVIAGSLRVASVLLREAGRGSLEGQRIAILVGPSAAFVEAFFGILLAGGCVVVLSPLHPAPETRYFSDDAGVRTVLLSAELRELAASLAANPEVRVRVRVRLRVRVSVRLRLRVRARLTNIRREVGARARAVCARRPQLWPSSPR